MPTVSVFYGILIRMFFLRSPTARIFMRDTASSRPRSQSKRLKLRRVSCPSRALILVREWAMIHREELREDWQLCRANATPGKIEPLVLSARSYVKGVMYWDIVEVEPRPDYCLFVRFKDKPRVQARLHVQRAVRREHPPDGLTHEPRRGHGSGKRGDDPSGVSRRRGRPRSDAVEYDHLVAPAPQFVGAGKADHARPDDDRPAHDALCLGTGREEPSEARDMQEPGARMGTRTRPLGMRSRVRGRADR